MHKLLKKEELMWFQRSKTKWITDGDHNTKYYHLKTVHRRRKNKIVMLKNNEGKWIEEEDQVRQLFIEHYEKFFALHDIGQR